MMQSLGLTALVVADYDEALEFYVGVLGFERVEDRILPDEAKRWVVVAPPGAIESRLLLARAVGPEQTSRVGNQTGGRVFLFLRTDDFWRDYEAYRDRGVAFVRGPKEESYGTVAVFEDLYGNLWDLIGPPGSRSASSESAASSRAAVTVRSVTTEDLETWLRLRRALWPDGSEAEHRAEIEAYFAGRAAEPQAVLLAVDGEGQAVGLAELSLRAYAEGCDSSPVAYLEGWYVDAAVRRRGIGRALVAAGEAWGRERGCSELASDADPANEVSRRAHRGAGFEEVGLVRCFRKGLSAP